MSELPKCRLCESAPLSAGQLGGDLFVRHTENSCPVNSNRIFKISEWTTLMGAGEPVAEVAEINGQAIVYWDKSLPIGTKLYTHPAPAVDDAAPNMFWDDDGPEDSFADSPLKFAQKIADEMIRYGDVFTVTVRCAKSLPNKKMRIWHEPDGYGGYDTKWEWME